MSWFTPVERAFKKAVHGERVRMDYLADGLGVRGRNMSFLDDPVFANSWNEVAAINNPYWHGATPDIRWRAHLAIWAAEQALRLEGDFAEFGLNTGILSAMICKVTGLSNTNKNLFLFDTFEGILIEQSSPTERRGVELLNRELYKHDAYEVAKEAFRDYENAILIKGVLPGSLNGVAIDKYCYVSIDLNATKPEMAVIQEIWESLCLERLLFWMTTILPVTTVNNTKRGMNSPPPRTA
jgi:hypothetical protein